LGLKSYFKDKDIKKRDRAIPEEASYLGMQVTSPLWFPSEGEVTRLLSQDYCRFYIAEWLYSVLEKFGSDDADVDLERCLLEFLWEVGFINMNQDALEKHDAYNKISEAQSKVHKYRGIESLERMDEKQLAVFKRGLVDSDVYESWEQAKHDALVDRMRNRHDVRTNYSLLRKYIETETLAKLQ